MPSLRHTVTRRGKRVLVTLKDGSFFADRFVERAKSRRWILLEARGRVPMSEVKGVADLKGPLDLGRLKNIPLPA